MKCGKNKNKEIFVKQDSCIGWDHSSSTSEFSPFAAFGCSQSSQQDKNTTSRPSTSSMKHTTISFSAPAASPDNVSHVVLLPKNVNKRKRKMLPCPRCDFTFRSVASRDEHLVIHSLEDDFNRIHGIVSNSNHADFDDFVQPKSPHPTPLPKKSKSLVVNEPASTSLTHQAHSAAPDSAASSSLVCDFCDKRGFPSRKALRYHYFRIHGQPMRKIVCPEQGCQASFVSKQWTSMKGSLIKHLRFVHRVSIATCLFQCDICHTSFSGKPKEHSCFTSDDQPIVLAIQQELQCPHCHATPHSAIQAQEALEKENKSLGVPCIRHSTRLVSEASQILAPPVADVPLIDAAPPPSEHEDEPLFHFAPIFQDILACDPSHDCAQLLSDAYCQLITEASSLALPNQSVPVPFSQARPLNIEDPQQCQRLYKRNRRRAIREIQKNVGERCSIPPNDVAAYFSAIWRTSTSDSGFYSAPSSEREEVLNLPLSVAEVLTAFRSCENTAPGPDRLTYNHWRSIDPRATILTRLFNCCLHIRLIPDEWKQSTTILLPKAGDPSSLTNWRPIALGNTAYKAIQGDAAEHRVLAFADDLVLLADSADQLQAQLNHVNDLLHRISLSLNPAKCKSLHICAGVPAGVRNTSFSINGLPIPAMAEFDHARFLGKPVGFNACPDYSTINDMSELGMNILCSALAPWQRLDALKAFFFPATQFAMRTGQFKKLTGKRSTEWLGKR
ncbi:retrovirus-related Pol polyprotein from type-2 retrotransposable element R2DM [Caerostris darwini]|uniref:Retrovirus-related Pol polyprotein from type-2 retrotransposable element R2DM n=1 Tax=Caerostris darwini TaxID=1538125 RepID=A0AAV4TRT2_9ARAC|nr:retrovirus-related Pol polyprotein from type-2 retrotransposable element R2DM [Caerostris darwini]